METGLSKIGQISVIVHDLDAATRFYKETLGMKFLFQVPKMSFFDCGGIRLVLGIPETAEFDHPASVIYYLVEDIRTTYSEFVKRGVQFLGEPHFIAKVNEREIWMAFFYDTDRNVLALMSEK